MSARSPSSEWKHLQYVSMIVLFVLLVLIYFFGMDAACRAGQYDGLYAILGLLSIRLEVLFLRHCWLLFPRELPVVLCS